MTVYDFAGLLAGVTGLGLALAGLLVAFLAGLRVLAVRRRGRGRLARGLLVGGLWLALCGAGLFLIEELAPFRRAADRAAGPLAGAALAVAIVAGLRASRRPRPATAAPAPTGPGAPSEPSAPPRPAAPPDR